MAGTWDLRRAGNRLRSTQKELKHDAGQPLGMAGIVRFRALCAAPEESTNRFIACGDCAATSFFINGASEAPTRKAE